MKKKSQKIKSQKMERLNLKNHFFAVFPKLKKKLNVMTFLSFQQTLTCFFESVEKNLEVEWNKRRAYFFRAVTLSFL